MKLLKYPRTRHVEGSRLQAGDLSDDLPLADLANMPVVVEEKLDGANAAVSFDAEGRLLLQSRGHYLTGGARERHFDLLKTWASAHMGVLHDVLGARYVMYGEWMYAKHAVFYDRLPHYFLEFDVLDREDGVFLSTPARRSLLMGLPVMPVPVLHQGHVEAPGDWVRSSLYKSANWRDALEDAAGRSGSRMEFVAKQTEDSALAEGVYLKHEEDGVVKGRYKFVRGDFLQVIQSSDSHWHNRPILLNALAEGVDVFASVLGVPGAYDV